MPKKNPTPPVHLGARLAALRKAAGLTQVELAEAIGISQRMVSYYEKTEDHPLAKLLRHFAAALEVSTDELLGTEAANTPVSQKTQRKPRKQAD